MYTWIALGYDGTRHEGHASSDIAARQAAVNAIAYRGSVLVFDASGTLIPWCSIDAYLGDGPQG